MNNFLNFNYFNTFTYKIKRITILSLDENQKENSKILSDILNEKNDLIKSDADFSDSSVYPLKEARELFEKNYLLTQLKKNHGNVSKTADVIGMERSALHRKLKSLGIKGIN